MLITKGKHWGRLLYMMNSMNNDLARLIRDVEARYPDAGLTLIQSREASLDLDERDLHSALSFLKNHGQRQLSIISCIDWIEENRFQLVFNTFNWEYGIRLHLRTMVDREDPRFKTVTNIYPGAKFYEREIHEFFGLVFEGNEDCTLPLFLENWKEMPPYRKDFISQEFSDSKYPKRVYKKSYDKAGGGCNEGS